MKTRIRRIFGGLALIVLALLIGLAIAAWVRMDGTLPPTDGTIRLSGLDGPVDITFDSMGVAQVWADTEHDAFFGLGWMHAADRLFQTDFVRRLSQGRLSELLGDATVDFDKDRRRDGHTRLAALALETLSPENQDRLQAYADGINAYVREGGDLPFEYTLLQAEYEPWQVYDALTVLSFMTWYSDALQNRDGLFATLDRDSLTDAVRTLPLGYPPWAPTTIDAAREAPGPVSDLRSQAAASLAASLLESGAASYTPARSSNAWVIAPSRSSSGRALFSSDPHLDVSRLPQFWYYIGLHVRGTWDALGITVPGLPFIVMGHNGNAAWAFTAGGVDVTDYYRERLKPDNPNFYLADVDPSRGEDSLRWRQIETIQDTITIASADSTSPFTIQLTRHGPVDPRFTSGDTLYARHWAGADADLDAAMSAGVELMHTADFESFCRAVTSMGALNANWMYADRDGNIGYQLGTPLPQRREASPSLPLDGWIAENDWKGFLPSDSAPSILNPPAGWLANSNNKPDAASPIPGAYASDRILRITDLLRSQEQFSADDMRRFQQDRTDLFLMQWKSLVDLAAPLVTDSTGALDEIAAWSGSADLASKATGLLVVFLQELSLAVFADELGDHAAEISRFTLEQVFFGNDSVWIDDITTPDTTESRLEISRRALERSLLLVAGRQWGDMQSLHMAHPMANVPLIGRVLSLRFGPWPWSGTSGTLNSSFSQRTGPRTYQTLVGPSWRFVLDFADVDGAMMVLPAGNSGNPVSPHFFDFFDLWQSGRYWNVPITAERVYARAASVLTLSPPDDSLAVDQ